MKIPEAFALLIGKSQSESALAKDAHKIWVATRTSSEGMMEFCAGGTGVGSERLNSTVFGPLIG